MSGGIFLARSDGSLVEMREQAYKNEDVLQNLLTDHPSLLPGDQINPESPRRWILVKHEASVPDEDGDTSLSVDHLFLDQDGIPTLVESKRSSDSRSRREVAAQMLDYASNGVAYWSADELRRWFEATCRKHGRNPLQELARLLAKPCPEQGTEADEFQDGFWASVQKNLRDRHIRMIFVADHIPKMLRRIVTYLGEQLTSAGVIAIEIKQYVDASGEHRTIVPRIVGLGDTSEDKVTQNVAKCSSEEFKAAIQKVGEDYWKVVDLFSAKLNRVGGSFRPCKNSMGACFKFKSGSSALVYISCEGGVLHPVSESSLQEYVVRGDLAQEDQQDLMKRQHDLLSKFGVKLEYFDRWSDTTGRLDVNAYGAYLDMLLEFYKQRVLPGIHSPAQ